MPDQGYIAVGRKRVGIYNYMFAMRLNAYGDTIWTKLYKGGSAYEIEKLADGNFVINGSSLFKIDINGNRIWETEFSGGSLKSSLDSGFYIVSNYTLKKYDSKGNIIWLKNYSENLGNGIITDMSICQDSTIFLIGDLQDTLSNKYNLFLFRVNSNGVPLGLKTFYSEYYPAKMVNTNNHTFVFSGTINYSAFLVKFDTLGNLIWERVFDNGYPNYNECRFIVRTFDDGYAFGGTHHNGNYDYYMRVIKTDSFGNEQWRKLYGFNDHDEGFCLRQTSDSGYIVIGIRDNYNLGDIYVVKADKNGYAAPPVLINSSSVLITQGFQLENNYPNPFNNETEIRFRLLVPEFVELSIFNIEGRKVRTIINSKINEGYYKIKFEGKDLVSGIYFCQIKTRNFKKTIKMVLTK